MENKGKKSLEFVVFTFKDFMSLETSLAKSSGDLSERRG